jgi:hypothetical protein
MSRTIGRVGFLVVCLAVSSTARADDKAACVDAYGKAQRLRSASHLVSAREQLRVCAQASCPKFITRDCTAWLMEVESRLSSVVLYAKDSKGAEVSAVTVAIDGTVVAEQLDGHGIEVDGGKHVFTFTFPDGKKVDQTYVVLEGQKAQRVGVELPLDPPSSPAPARKSSDSMWGQGSPTMAKDGSSSWNGRKTLAVVVVGAGVAGVAVGAVFGLNAISSFQSQKNACAPGNCTDRSAALTDHTNAANASTLSTVGFIAGGALVATGAVLFFTAPNGREGGEGGTTAGLQAVPGAGPAGAGVLLRGRF